MAAERDGPLATWPSSRGLAAWCGVSLAAGLAFLPAFAPLERELVAGEGRYGIVDFELAATAATGNRILADWSSHGALEAARTSIAIDYAFLVTYSCLLAGVVVWSSRRLAGRPRAWGFGLVPWCFAAGLFDAVENSLALVTLHVGRAAALRSGLTAAFAGAKFIIIIAGLAHVLLGVVAGARARASS